METKGAFPGGNKQSNSGAAPAVETMLASPPAEAEAQATARLLRVVQAHVDAETATLRSYRRLATRAADPVAALLMGLVVEDEERHHELLRRMAARLRDAVDWTASRDALPTGAGVAGLEHGGDALALLTHVRDEEESAQQLEALATENGPLYGGLFALLLRTMALDSEKHAQILRFVCQRMVCRV